MREVFTYYPMKWFSLEVVSPIFFNAWGVYPLPYEGVFPWSRFANFFLMREVFSHYAVKWFPLEMVFPKTQQYQPISIHIHQLRFSRCANLITSKGVHLLIMGTINHLLISNSNLMAKNWRCWHILSRPPKSMNVIYSS
jgi:hypothetical protein